LLGGTIKFHLREVGTLVALTISDNTYVDNVSLDANSVKEAHKIYLESKDILKKASMNLREWILNSSQFLNLLPKMEVARGDVVRIFGVTWNHVEDHLQINGINLCNFDVLPTKREIFKIIQGSLTHWV